MITTSKTGKYRCLINGIRRWTHLLANVTNCWTVTGRFIYLPMITRCAGSHNILRKRLKASLAISSYHVTRNLIQTTPVYHEGSQRTLRVKWQSVRKSLKDAEMTVK